MTAATQLDNRNTAFRFANIIGFAVLALGILFYALDYANAPQLCAAGTCVKDSPNARGLVIGAIGLIVLLAVHYARPAKR
ncbi:hypothetical protein [Antrihabitans cavernicola]|uniref:Uncharacterized protein n=1 Tax=Antrihabitans cavernicola TaxID=2495913 RepID=A0A5A7S4N7_9NOCA|nr:hypothetical protein [Spelaeibacter cavernicola]KAA0016761.1 hypothetical protein FOY51_25785 [Spelaeibacter cavernicola]